MPSFGGRSPADKHEHDDEHEHDSPHFRIWAKQAPLLAKPLRSAFENTLSARRASSRLYHANR
jgi:hypothetical protein